MSSFKYGIHNENRIGVWIKYDKYINSDIFELIKKNRNKRFFETVERIIVDDYDHSTGEVLLEIWCDSFIDIIFKKHRYNVFYISIKPNENWSCHGDLGTGLKE